MSEGSISIDATPISPSTTTKQQDTFLPQEKGILAHFESKKLFTDTLSNMYAETVNHAYVVKSTVADKHVQRRTRVVLTTPEGKSFACTWRFINGYGNNQDNVEMGVLELGSDLPRVLQYTKYLDEGAQKRNGKEPEYYELTTSDKNLGIKHAIEFMKELKKARYNPEGTNRHEERDITAAGGTNINRNGTNVIVDRAFRLIPSEIPPIMNGIMSTK